MNYDRVREQEEDEEGRTCTGMLCVSGTTTPSEVGIYKCKSLLTNVRKILNHGIDYSGVTLTLFLFLFKKKKNKKQTTQNPKSSQIRFLQNKNVLLAF